MNEELFIQICSCNTPCPIHERPPAFMVTTSDANSTTNESEYKCLRCGGIWSFIPEDYEEPWDYPTICPHCSMPLWETIRSIYKVGGISEVFYWIKARYFN